MLAPSGPHDLHAPISRTARYKKVGQVLCKFLFYYFLILRRNNILWKQTFPFNVLLKKY
jgi:hypothetical protein